ncbi:hypothetical protein CTI12_AA266970 [Artemisia annua]|uniref:Pentatricopeptide repeat-containing protein n=1 Tax=Artemisia annua TaxID=35608 RepID=A0A2U1NGX9_ARTAN|nr:hypothetical protein CTI12_AA266970 [Artemisia annua]
MGLEVLTGTRLTLHNRILKLIRENDLTEAVLLTRHSVYSNCKPTIFTVNAVMNACLRQAKYAELLNLHRFITQAAISGNIVTYNLVISTYLECRKVDTALEHYKQLVENAPFEANSTTYRVLVKGLVDNGRLDKALEIKEDILGKGWEADAVVYSYLMSGEAKNGNWEGVFGLYEELKEKLGGVVNDGVVYGSLMKGYFLRGMEDEAMRCFEEVFADGSEVKMSAVAWNSVLDALFKNGKFDVGLKVFDKMLGLHDPPKALMVNLGSYNVVVDGYCGEKRFDDAIKVFNSMGVGSTHQGMPTSGVVFGDTTPTLVAVWHHIAVALVCLLVAGDFCDAGLLMVDLEGRATAERHGLDKSLLILLDDWAANSIMSEANSSRSGIKSDKELTFLSPDLNKELANKVTMKNVDENEADGEVKVEEDDASGEQIKS